MSCSPYRRQDRNKTARMLCGLLLGGGLAGTGCTGYRIGTTLPPGIRSVYVPVFENRTDEPQLEAKATQATVAELQRDGTLRIEREEQADAVLHVVLLGITEEPLRYQRGERDAAAEYRLRMQAEITLVRQATGEAVVDRVRVGGRETFEFAGTMSASRQTALPGASTDLARRIVTRLAEHW